jgi:hypothetical protein
MKAQFKVLASIALVALICLGAIGVAQTTGGGGDTPEKVEKKIEITEENGVKTMIVTTTTDGITAVETYTADEVDEYLLKEGGMVHGGDASHVNMRYGGDDTDGAMTIHIETDEDGNTVHEVIDIEQLLEGMDMSFLEDLKGLEGLKDLDNEEMQKHIKEAMAHLKDLDIDFDFDFSTGEDGAFIFETDVNDGGTGEHAHTKVVIKGGEDGVSSWTGDDGTVTIDIQSGNDGEHKKVIIISKGCVIEDLDEAEAKDLGVAESNNDLKINELKFYPNPTKGQFTLEFEVPESGATQITITDIEGKQVYQEKVKGAGAHSKQIDISDESKGIYILNLRQGKKSTTKRIVVD